MNAASSLPAVAERWRLRASDFELLHAAGALVDVRRAELIDGDIYAMSPQMARHSRIKTGLALALHQAARAAGHDLSILTEVSVVTAGDSVPEPDIVLSSYKGDRFVPADTVALVVEVADTTLPTDLGRKLQLYARAVVPEYWVVDVAGGRVIAHHRPMGDGYAERRDVALGQPLTAATIEGLGVETVGLTG